MRGKPVDYLWSFLIGGALCVAAQLVFELLLSAGVEFGLSITLMLAIMAALSGAATILGQYQKLEGLGGFGAMLPFTGFSAAIIEFTAAALKEGLVLLAERKSPRYIQDKINSFVDTREQFLIGALSSSYAILFFRDIY